MSKKKASLSKRVKAAKDTKAYYQEVVELLQHDLARVTLRLAAAERVAEAFDELQAHRLLPAKSDSAFGCTSGSLWAPLKRGREALEAWRTVKGEARDDIV